MLVNHTSVVQRCHEDDEETTLETVMAIEIHNSDSIPSKEKPQRIVRIYKGKGSSNHGNNNRDDFNDFTNNDT